MSPKQRRFPGNRGTKRNAPSKDPKQLIIIVCEGEKTEPRYLEEFAKSYGNNLVALDIIDGAGVPRTIVEKAVEKNREQLRKVRKSKDSFDKFQVWAVFDVDEHPKVPEAKNLADGHGIKVGISNPCIEIWGILHFERHTAFIDRKAAQSKLATLMTGYDHNSGATFNFNEIRGEYDRAKTNARHLETRHKTGGSPIDENPSSNLYKLLDEIIKYGRES